MLKGVFIMSNLKKMRRKKRRRKEKLEEIDKMVKTINSLKYASMLVLRNNGWGETRLRRFSEELDVVLNDISEKRLSFSDIPGAIEEETGLTYGEITLNWHIKE